MQPPSFRPRCIFLQQSKIAMGIPIETGIENLEEVLLKLSVTDRVKLIQWISESVVAEGQDTSTAADVPGRRVDVTKGLLKNNLPR